MAAVEGLISIYFVNAAGSVLVACGVGRKLSTARIALAFRVPDRTGGADLRPYRCRRQGDGGKPWRQKLPKGALVDEDGSMSEDPHCSTGLKAEGPRIHAQGKGAIRAFGDHKGSGLALMCELLGGALTGNGATKHDRRFSNGMLAIYIDPKVVDPAHFFDGEVARYISFFKDSKLAQGHDAVLIPGEPEAATRADRVKNGVPLTEETWNSIAATARSVGIDDAAVAKAIG